jgi:hypothetical protein
MDFFQALLYRNAVPLQEGVHFVPRFVSEQAPRLPPEEPAGTDSLDGQTLEGHSFDGTLVIAEMPGNLFGYVERNLHYLPVSIIRHSGDGSVTGAA